MNGPQGKILVIRGGAIGDFILTLPALAALRAQFPQARLELLGYARTAGLALAGGLVDSFRSIEARPLAGFFARHGTLADELQEFFAPFTIIVSYLYDPDGVFQANVARCSKAQFIAGPHRPDDRAGLHATEAFLKPLERLAIFGADPVPRLHLAETQVGGPNDAARADPMSPLSQRAPTLALHLGSGSESKNWPETRWAELLSLMIGQTGWNLLLIGGEAEGQRLDRLAACLPKARVRLVSGLPLAELARQMAECDGFVGHDSGISHLAMALGLPGVVLWGPTQEAVWRPRGDRVTVLREPAGLRQLPVERVLREVESITS